MNIRTTPLAALLVLGAAFSASAGDDDVVGVWKRPGETARYYVIEKGEEGRLGGRLVNPPFESMSATLDLKLEGSSLEGACNWVEKVEDKVYREATAWDYELQGDKLVGKAEALDWEEGVVYHRQWIEYTMERVARVGLVTEGEAGEAGFGEEIEGLDALAGGYVGLGGAWAAKVEGEALVLSPVGHHEGVTIRLMNERGTLRGEAKLPDGGASKVELGLNEGALSGRSSWNAGPVEGWSPISFTRLEREGPVAEGAVEAPAPGEGSIVGAWKRADGVYLRLRAEGEGVSGVLCDATGKAQARVSLREEEGVWRGTVNHGDYETKLELSVGAEGLSGRGEWASLHEGKLVATGWAARSFKALTRLN